MRLFRGILASLAGAAIIASAGFAAAASNPKIIPVSTETPTLEEIRPPIGWIAFCQEPQAEDCRVPTLAPQKLTLTQASWDLVVRVNRTVNANIEQVEDIVLYGVQEKWTYPEGGKGDCEDLALLKRHMLIKDGVPRQALLMTVVRDETGAGHAVLTLVTDRGDFVLDSKTSRILPWRATGYGFIKRQSQSNPNIWVKLGEPASPTLTVAQP
jgi:predicted transglutaminase-like cysteine proteinase